MNHEPAGRRTHLVAGAILGIAAFILVLAATDPPGPGLDPDAMSYMGAAESLAWQGRYRVPAAPWWSADSTAALTHFPPGYPTALALPVRLGMAPPQAARLVSALAAAVTVTTLVALVATATATLAGVLLGLALLATPAMELVHISVLSEPLFLAGTALLLAAMTRRRTHPLLLGISAALGALVRYAGVAFTGAVALWALAERGTPRERARRAALALLPTVLLHGAWLVRTRLLHEPAEIRRVGRYGGLGPTLLQGAATIRDWLVPDPLAWSDPIPYRPALAFAALLLIGVVVAIGARHAFARDDAPAPHARPPARLLAACALLVGCYVGMLVVSRLFADPRIPFDDRILAPVILLAAAAIATAMALWWRSTTRLLPRVALALALACWWAASAATTRAEVRYATTWGSDFAGEQWRRGELLAWARADGAAHPLFTNWPPALYFHLHRAAWYVPLADDTTRLAAFADTVRARDGRVLLFSVGDAEYMSAETLANMPGLRVVAELADGVVLQASER